MDMWIENIKNHKQEIGFAELVKVRKEILLFFDDTLGEGNLSNVWLPKHAYNTPYWEYLALNGNKHFLEEEKRFYKVGCLTLIIAMCNEYLDYTSGDQNVFGDYDLEFILECISKFESTAEKLKQLKALSLLGLKLVQEAVVESDEFSHPELQEFIEGGVWVHDAVIKEYYQNSINNN